MTPDRTPPVDAEQLLRLLLESAPDCAVFPLDADGRVAGWQGAAERLFGYAEGEILGQPLARFFTPEDVGRGEPERALRTAASSGRASGERWLVRKDGAWFWSACDLTALRDEKGRPRGCVLTVRDRTEQRLARDLLEKRERRFCALIENAWDAVALLGPDGIVLYASPPTTRVLGYGPDEFVGRNVVELIHPDDLPRTWEVLSRLIVNAKEKVIAAFRCRHKDGSWRWLEGMGTNLLEEPSVRAVAVNFHDVTRQREAEQARSQLAAIVESSHDAIIGLDLDGVVVRLELRGRAAVRLHGGGDSGRTAVPPHTARPAQRAARSAGAAQARRDDRRLRNRAGAQDGARVDVSLSISPIKDAEGRIVGAAKVTRDATGRRKAERRQRLLAESGAVLNASLDDQAIFESTVRLVVPALADHCVIHVRGDGDELRQAAAAHVDADQDAAPRDHDPRASVIVPLSARGRTLGAITLIASASGRRYDASDQELVEELAHRVALAVDNARLFRELHEADRHKGEWIAMLAHELRNPLAPLLNALHVLRQSGAERSTVEQAGCMMERQVRHMARLVDDLLDVSRVAQGKIRLRRERLDLARLVRTTAADLRPLLTEAGVGLTVETPETPMWLTGDATRLAQVLSNLLDNAAKFTNRGGQVRVKLTALGGRAPGEPGASAPGGQAELRVDDTGIGIEPEVLPRLFESFSQADRSLHRTRGGLGLGLALVKGLTELHGGKVQVFSAGRTAERSSWCGCRWTESRRRCRSRCPAGAWQPRPCASGCASWWWRTTGTRRTAANAAGAAGPRGAGGVHGAGRGADGGGVAAAVAVVRHRASRPGRLRRGACLAIQPGDGPRRADRRHRLRQRRRPPPGPRERLRSPAHEAGRSGGAAAAAARAGVAASRVASAPGESPGCRTTADEARFGMKNLQFSRAGA